MVQVPEMAIESGVQCPTTGRTDHRNHQGERPPIIGSLSDRRSLDHWIYEIWIESTWQKSLENHASPQRAVKLTQSRNWFMGSKQENHGKANHVGGHFSKLFVFQVFLQQIALSIELPILVGIRSSISSFSLVKFHLIHSQRVRGKTLKPVG